MDFTNHGFKLREYKCFGDEWQGFEQIYPVNVIIGKNNAGKSSLVDLVERALAGTLAVEIGDGLPWHLLLHKELTEADITAVFPAQSVPELGVRNLHSFGMQFCGDEAVWIPEQKRGVHQHKPELKSVGGYSSFHRGCASFEPPQYRELWSRLLRHLGNPFMGHYFVRLASERDLGPEPASAELDVDPNGRGATNLIRNYLTSAKLPHELVEQSMLEGLNEIFEPDAHFTRIMTLHDKDETWEVFLEEDGERLVRLSDSGSGLKTVLLVLTFLYLVPNSKNPKDPGKYFFGFEELENNLHPALQRRLFRYLREFAQEHGSHFFLTTHSNVVIDMFSQDDDAQLLHVQREDGQATVQQVSTYAQQRAILDDLAVRASDLLQSNCIVWLEGPSDRLYFNKWVELWTDGELREGSHYQCVFYGGSLLAHYSAEELGASVDDLVEVLRVNRHAILMADSDRDEAGDEIKPRLARIREEMDDTEMYCWVTAGREVENYIPVEATRALLDDERFEAVGRFESYPEKIKEARGRKTFDKVGHANAVKKEFTKGMIEETSDLAERLDDVCEKIRAWN